MSLNFLRAVIKLYFNLNLQLVSNQSVVNYYQQQQFESAQKNRQMQPNEQNKSTDKISSHESQRKKRRPSLFPIRNSARRKSSMSQAHHIFDPHENQFNSNSVANRDELNPQLDTRETKSDAQFQYRTPSVLSDHSTPRTSRISPKEFIADTPFVPFVHQSLTKMVWQTEEVIPEEKDELERKESQTQKINEAFQQIKEEKPQDEDQSSLDDAPLKSSQIRSTKSQPRTSQIQSSQNLKPCVTVSISVSASSQNQQIIHPQPETKAQYNGVQPLVEAQNQIEHNQYVSKAATYFEETKEQTEENQQIFQSREDADNFLQNKKRILSFSYIDCISIRPILKPVAQIQQQTSRSMLSKGQIDTIGINPGLKLSQQTQINKPKFQIGNYSHNHVKSIKKHSCIVQTCPKQKLAIMSRNYQQMIGEFKQYIHQSQQIGVETHTQAQQTLQEEPKNFSISEQVNYSISLNVEKKFNERIDKLEEYIKGIYETKQAQMIELRNRRSVDRQINTDNVPDLHSESKSKKKKVVNKSVRNFACQYDTKDLAGPKPSLKRVSIADTKIIYEIEDSVPSTQTFQQKNSSSKNKKSKNSEEKQKVKMQPRKPQIEEESDQPAEQRMQLRKKRKSGKTPKRKNKNKD